MIYIREYIKKYFDRGNKQIPLGRWNIDYCNNKINKKIDLSNEDHCGPCGQYINSIHKQNVIPNPNNLKSLVTEKIIDSKK